MKRSFIYSLILLIISFTLIFFNFNLIPKNISFDEIAFTRLALSLNNSNYIPYSELATGHSTLYFYIILLSFKIFGVSNFALRLPSAIFGILSILVFFVLLKNVLIYYYFYQQSLLDYLFYLILREEFFSCYHYFCFL